MLIILNLQSIMLFVSKSAIYSYPNPIEIYSLISAYKRHDFLVMLYHTRLKTWIECMSSFIRERMVVKYFCFDESGP